MTKLIKQMLAYGALGAGMGGMVPLAIGLTEGPEYSPKVDKCVQALPTPGTKISELPDSCAALSVLITRTEVYTHENSNTSKRVTYVVPTKEDLTRIAEKQDATNDARFRKSLLVFPLGSAVLVAIVGPIVSHLNEKQKARPNSK